MGNPAHTLNSTMLRILIVGLVANLSIFAPSAFSAEDNTKAGQGVQITQLPDRLHVELNGHLFTEYYFKDVPRPFC